MDLLVNKYSPKTIRDVIGNPETIETLQCIVENRNPPHLLFTGPPGTGKTTSAKILAKELLGTNGLLELNASDDRGIDTVRTTIKDFSRKMIDNVPFKIIILDECDSMTVPAQQAMRRIMEVYSNDCKFILICNDFSKIFEPIQSRCAILKFDKISQTVIFNKIKEICNLENIKISDDAIRYVVDLCDGDMRQSLNVLQPCINSQFEITEDYIVKLIGVPSHKLISNLLDLLISKEIDKALVAFDLIWEDKYDQEDLITSFFRVAKNRDLYSIVKQVGIAHMRIIKGCTSKMVFYGLFYDIINTLD